MNSYSISQKKCITCGDVIPNRIIIDGAQYTLTRRKKCFGCSPFRKRKSESIYKGVTRICSKCNKEYSINKNNHLLNMCSSCYMRDKHREIKQLAVEYKGNSCLVCGYNRCIAALVFHHMKDKKFSISGSIRSWNKTKEELDKCVLLCSNCHDELHNGLLENSYLINLEQERIVKLQ